MSHRAILERALSNFGNPATRQAYFDLYADNVVLQGYDGVAPGLENVKQFYAAIWSAFPDAAVELEDAFETGDRLACRFTMTGTHLGTFNGIPSTGKPIRLPGITILRFENGKCVERWSVADFLKLLGQIGALPA